MSDAAAAGRRVAVAAALLRRRRCQSSAAARRNRNAERNLCAPPPPPTPQLPMPITSGRGSCGGPKRTHTRSQAARQLADAACRVAQLAPLCRKLSVCRSSSSSGSGAAVTLPRRRRRKLQDLVVATAATFGQANKLVRRRKHSCDLLGELRQFALNQTRQVFRRQLCASPPSYLFGHTDYCSVCVDKTAAHKRRTQSDKLVFVSYHFSRANCILFQLFPICCSARNTVANADKIVSADCGVARARDES